MADAEAWQGSSSDRWACNTTETQMKCNIRNCACISV